MLDYGLVFAGGGARGAAHVGVLLALEEERFLPDCAAGASAGAIVAGLYAAGLDLGTMKEAVLWLSKHGKSYLDPDIIQLIRLVPQIFMRGDLSLTGLLKGNRLMRFLCDLTENRSLEETVYKLLIPAVDIKSGNTIVFTNMIEGPLPSRALHQEHTSWERSGTLCEIMMASASVPAVFQPRRMNGYCLVDGGVTNNLPVDLLIAAGKKRVIGVDIGADYKMSHDNSIIEISSHSFSIMSRELKDCRSSGEILMLKPPLKQGAGLLTFEQMEACMEDGYLYTKRQMPKIRRVLEREGII